MRRLDEPLPDAPLTPAAALRLLVASERFASTDVAVGSHARRPEDSVV